MFSILRFFVLYISFVSFSVLSLEVMMHPIGSVLSQEGAKKDTKPVEIKLIEVVKVIPSVELDIRYATTNNFTGKVVYQTAKCCLQEGVVKALAKVQQDLSVEGLGLKIFDGYRPLSVQKIFWKICPDERYVADPAKGSRHNRGCAVDLTLVNLSTGEELEMPSPYDDFSEKSHRDCKIMSDKAFKNLQILEFYMEKHGFIGMSTEWWHFDYKDWEKYPVLDDPLDELP